MKKLAMAFAFLSAALSAADVAWAEKYSLKDEGEFQPMGHRVEFYDRFGWRSYAVDFDFGLEEGGQSLTKGSRLSLRITKRDGSSWDYTCKTGGRRQLNSNINFIYGKGLSVVVDCRIDDKSFARAVELHPDDVAASNLVFQAIVMDGKVRPGAQRGISLQPAAQLAATELVPYLGASEDAAGLAVVFQSLPTLQ